ncbi:MAG TPA: HD domain-containing protein [Chitinophagaceae bacterium]|nr:HD domain-containing protein [Chitinophagaceae bacterium]
MNYSTLEENAGRFVTHVFESPQQVQFPYHNLAHTKAVVNHANEISVFYALNEEDIGIINIAAWFHDIGQLHGGMTDHEDRSVLIMNNYLKTMDAATTFIEAAGNCVMATKYRSNLKALPEKIICDADTYHFGTPVFRETEFLIKKEMEIRSGQEFPQWHEGSLQLLKDHVFFTEYCQLLLGQGKQENIAWLQSLIQSQKEPGL